MSVPFRNVRQLPSLSVVDSKLGHRTEICVILAQLRSIRRQITITFTELKTYSNYP